MRVICQSLARTTCASLGSRVQPDTITPISKSVITTAKINLQRQVYHQPSWSSKQLNHLFFFSYKFKSLKYDGKTEWSPLEPPQLLITHGDTNFSRNNSTQALSEIKQVSWEVFFFKRCFAQSKKKNKCELIS